jgi:hypothetical protein
VRRRTRWPVFTVGLMKRLPLLFIAGAGLAALTACTPASPTHAAPPATQPPSPQPPSPHPSSPHPSAAARTTVGSGWVSDTGAATVTRLTRGWL